MRRETDEEREKEMVSEAKALRGREGEHLRLWIREKLL